MDTALHRYTAFLKTVELESFSKAAAAMQYSQSAVSRMVKSLEDEYGVTLLKRSNKSVCLTHEGEALLPYIKEICRTTRLMQEQVTSLCNPQRGTLRLGIFTNMATHWLPGAIQRFRRDYPEINYNLLYGDSQTIRKWIAEERVDCGILPRGENNGLEVLPLFREEFRAVLPVGHPFAEKEHLSAKELDGIPFILPDKDNSSAISLYLAQHDISPDIKLTTWDNYAVLRMVESSAGISILNGTVLKNTRTNVLSLPLDPPLYVDMVFALKSIRSAAPLVRRFMEYFN